MYKKRTFDQTLAHLLALRTSFWKSDEKLNVTKAAKAMGINQPTLKRMIDGETAIPEKSNADKLCRYFGISLEQLIGDKPIASIDGADISEELQNTLSADEDELIVLYRQKSDQGKKLIRGVAESAPKRDK